MNTLRAAIEQTVRDYYANTDPPLPLNSEFVELMDERVREWLKDFPNANETAVAASAFVHKGCAAALHTAMEERLQA